MDKLLSSALLACFLVCGGYVISLLYYRSKSADSCTTMKIKELYIYPVKGLRGIAVKQASIGLRGFEFDRTFSLQKVLRNTATKEISSYETMLIGYNLELALFQAGIEYEDGQGSMSNGKVTITWPSPCSQTSFPLLPSCSGLEVVDVNLHGSKTKAHNMGDEISTWFSERLGFEVILVYIGTNSRKILGSFAPNGKAALAKNLVSRVRSMIPPLALPEERLAFNDIGQFLVVTRESTNNLSDRLPDGIEMDVTKFRPNIVLSGATKAWEEDFWAELTFNDKIKMSLTANCYRCQSITVDYKTGKTASDESGTVWKKLNKDRRVDSGAKYSPVFGRYGYCKATDQHQQLHLGDRVVVTRRNKQRTTWDWPNLTSFGLTS